MLLTEASVLRLTELGTVHAGVDSVLLKESLMPSLLDNFALLNHQNGIRMLDGGEPVRNNKAGFSLHQCPHGGLNLDFSPGIHI